MSASPSTRARCSASRASQAAASAELLESIAGLYPVASGHVTFYPPDGGKEKELVGLDPMKIRKSGIAMSFVPEDRLGMGLVGSHGHDAAT